MTELPLAAEWAARAARRAEVDRLWADGDILRAEGDILRAMANKIRAEADNLQVEASITWFDAVIKHYGTVKGEWDNGTCVVDGDRYEPIGDE
ncbi:MAG: hypothetical protein GY767_17780 [Shimia sp.]|nr:hypothetical protein [Shimia sp.]